MKKRLNIQQLQELQNFENKLAALNQKSHRETSMLSFLSADVPDEDEDALLGGRSYKHDKEMLLKEQIDNIVAGECPLCGLLIIQDVDSPFVEPGTEFSSWKITVTNEL